MTQWATLINSTVEKNENYELTFFDPALKIDFTIVKEKTGIEISKQLFFLLSETNGVQNKYLGDYLIFPTSEIIVYTNESRDYLKKLGIKQNDSYLFFADNGCGEHFGYKTKNNKIMDEQIWIWYPIFNEYRVVAPNLETWIVSWFSGGLNT